MWLHGRNQQIGEPNHPPPIVKICKSEGAENVWTLRTMSIDTILKSSILELRWRVMIGKS